jgi:predicted phage terminase large subunit-like protein
MPKTSASPQAALAERAKRELARRRFLPFCRYMDKRYPHEARHIQYLAEKLEQVYEFIASDGQRGIGRLMIFMPPRYWKSNTASQKFPAWVLGKNPDIRVMLASYGAELAGEHSGKVRDMIDGDLYAAIFGNKSIFEVPVEISEDRHKATNWALANHAGGMISAGVGGPLVGKGGHLLILDDPFKNREDADSETNRKKVMSWYRSSFYTRQEDHAAIIIIMTRWDQEDVAGQLLAKMASDDEDADRWEVISFPALALEANEYPTITEQFQENLLRGIFIPMGGDQLGRQPGEALWPEKHTAQQLKTIASNTEDYEFASQFQQSPRLPSGGFFDDGDFRIEEKAPEGLTWYSYMDLALGESQTSDLNATGAVALRGEDLFIRDVLDERELEKFLPEVRSRMLSDQERGTRWGVEDVAFQKLVFKEFMKDKALVNTEIAAVKPQGDKVERARPWRRRAKSKHVFLVRGTWNRNFIRQATSFPGRHDDMVDFVSGSVQMIAADAGENRKTVSGVARVSTAEQLFGFVNSYQ